MADNSHATVLIAGDGRPVVDPNATCEGCGARGTVGRAVRSDATGQPIEEHQFCADCWPEWSAFYRARWQEAVRRASIAWRDRAPENRASTPPLASGMWFESATWHGVIYFVQKLTLQARYYRDPPPRDVLGRVASEIRAKAHEKVGPTPIEVRAFLAEFGRDGSDAPAS